jgi:hypothetical protein
MGTPSLVLKEIKSKGVQDKPVDSRYVSLWVIANTIICRRGRTRWEGNHDSYCKGLISRHKGEFQEYHRDTNLWAETNSFFSYRHDTTMSETRTFSTHNTIKVESRNNNVKINIFHWFRVRLILPLLSSRLTWYKWIDRSTHPTYISAKAIALDESHLSHHLGTKALVVHLKGAQLERDAFNKFIRWGITTTWLNC